MYGLRPIRYCLILGFMILISEIRVVSAQPLPSSFRSLNPDLQWLQQMESAGINQSDLLNTELDSLHVQGVFMKWLRYMENHGYPFADISLAADSSFRWRIVSHNGPLIVLDTIMVKGDRPPDKNYLQGLLQFRKGMPYNQQWVNAIPGALSSDGNYSCDRPPGVEFLQKKARIYLYPAPVPRNQISILAGLQNDENGKTHLTGEADLKLYNLFQRGIEMGIEWKSPSQLEQVLQVRWLYPFLFFRKLGISLEYNLHRRDSTSLLQEWKAGVIFPASDNGHWELQFRNRWAKEQSSTTRSTSHSYFYGMGYTSSSWNCLGEIGLQQETKRSFAASIKGNYKKLWEINNWSQIHLKSRLEWNYVSGKNWNTADIPYWGGVNTLRGFQDLSLPGNSFLGTQTDYHIILDDHIRIPIFADIGYLEYDHVGQGYVGWGTGVYLIQKQGNMALYYALGQKWGEGLDWKAYKIHITYAHRF